MLPSRREKAGARPSSHLVPALAVQRPAGRRVASDDRRVAPALAFRPDIEGLRGVAVLLVVAFHIGIAGVGGGFVGVDVFFVLSGYLITALLLRELETTGRLSLWNFYARRLRRLLPASALVLGVTLALAALVFPPLRIASIAGSGRAVAVFAGNLYFSANATDYFRDDAATNPLLHTWSLAVEEQFYFVWPVLVLLAARPGLRRAWLPGVLAVLVALSLSASWWVTIADRPTAYYGTAMRAWEFALGAVLALPAVERLVRRPAPAADVAAALAGWLGVIAICGAAFAFSHRTPFPGVHAAVPVAGTVLVLLAGTRPTLAGSASWVLARPSLQWLGQHSYAWYLWHWPLLIVAVELIPTADGGGTLVTRAVAVLLALVAAVVTRALVEEPCRRTRLLRNRPRATVVLGVGTVVVLLAAATQLQRLATRASESPAQRAFTTATRDTPRLYRDDCAPATQDATVRLCEYGAPGARDTVLLFGDSHAAQWTPALEGLAHERGWTLLVLTKSACPSVDVSVFELVLQRRFEECDAWRQAALDSIRVRRPTLAIVASSSEYVLGGPRSDARASITPAEWEAGLVRTLSTLRGAGVPTLVLQDTPEAPHNVPLCLAKAQWRGQDPSRCDFSLADGVHGPAAAATERATARVEGAHAVSLAAALCVTGTCPAQVEGTIRFRDTRHLTASAARQMARAVGAALPFDQAMR